MGARFKPPGPGTDQRVEILAAGVSGDLADTVELEHTSVWVDGVPVGPYTLRVTQIYCREDGAWKVVHRHGDQLPIDQRQSLPAKHRRRGLRAGK